jgi:hypothetical protein
MRVLPPPSSARPATRYRQENYMEHDDPLPTPDPDVERYYK